MPLIETDEQNVPLVVNLDEAEKEQWRKEFGDKRESLIRIQPKRPASEFMFPVLLPINNVCGGIR